MDTNKQIETKNKHQIHAFYKTNILTQNLINLLKPLLFNDPNIAFQ